MELDFLLLTLLPEAPGLGALGLHDKDVVRVPVRRETLAAGGGEVGVGLARVSQLTLQCGDEIGQRRPVTVQSLKDHRRPTPHLVEDAAGVHQTGQRLPGDARGTGEG